MKTLPLQRPTPEQLPIIQETRPGVVVIRGAAGSGKTTTALLRLRQVTGFWLSRRKRLADGANVTVLVLTYNRTLRGYIRDLANDQIKSATGLTLNVKTFGKWSTELMRVPLLDDKRRKTKIEELCSGFPFPADFLTDEVDYAMGRFHPSKLDEYLTCRRDGRGASPRVDGEVRKKILNEIVVPYSRWKQRHRLNDWNDLAVQIPDKPDRPRYEIIVVDEAQDFSANQVRAIMACAANPSSVTFVLDATQRIYPRGFLWSEAGIKLQAGNSHRLKTNHRNTAEICSLAEPLVRDLDVGDDGTYPDFKSCIRHGPRPVILKGRYNAQAAYAVKYIQSHVNLAGESVAFLKPQGGHWFDTIAASLATNHLAFVDLTRRQEWPEDGTNIALCTMHSAKGLEFDHVIILGLNDQVTPHGSDPNDSLLDNWRRLLAMAITRARESVTLGYKPGEASDLLKFLDSATFDEVVL